MLAVSFHFKMQIALYFFPFFPSHNQTCVGILSLWKFYFLPFCLSVFVAKTKERNKLFSHSWPDGKKVERKKHKLAKNPLILVHFKSIISSRLQFELKLSVCFGSDAIRSRSSRHNLIRDKSWLLLLQSASKTNKNNNNAGTFVDGRTRIERAKQQQHWMRVIRLFVCLFFLPWFKWALAFCSLSLLFVWAAKKEARKKKKRTLEQAKVNSEPRAEQFIANNSSCPKSQHCERFCCKWICLSRAHWARFHCISIIISAT